MCVNSVKIPLSVISYHRNSWFLSLVSAHDVLSIIFWWNVSIWMIFIKFEINVVNQTKKPVKRMMSAYYLFNWKSFQYLKYQPWFKRILSNDLVDIEQSIDEKINNFLSQTDYIKSSLEFVHPKQQIKLMGRFTFFIQTWPLTINFQHRWIALSLAYFWYLKAKNEIVLCFTVIYTYICTIHNAILINFRWGMAERLDIWSEIQSLN